VRHLDRVDAGGVERAHGPADVGGGDAVPDGVHAVAQSDVLDEQFGGHRVLLQLAGLVAAARSAAIASA
jgi:hypothetical protein